MSKTNSGLVEYAKAQIGLPYWYGCYGQTATATLYSSKKKQYPSYYTASDFSKQYGKRVHDCVGLIKGYLWSTSATATPSYKSAQDKSASGMYSASSTKGKISTFPKTKGLLVYKSSSSSASKIHHVGVYGGDGYVYEAKGHAYGVVKTAFKSSDWQFWSQCPYITDDTTGTTTTSTTTTSSTKTTTTSSSSTPTYKVGSVYTLQVDKLNVRKGAGTSYGKVTFANLTSNAKANAYSNGTLKKGTKVTCKAVSTDKSGNIWIKIPSGYIAAYYNKKVYVS